MALPSLDRRSRMATAVLLIALFGSLIPVSTVLASVAVAGATGGSAVPADEFGTSDYTTLTGPGIAESAAGELLLGSTTILNTPSGFRFNAGSGNVSISGASCDLAGTLNVTATQATFTVTHASTVAGCIATVVGLQVQPTAGTPLATGTITKTGTSTAPTPGNYGTLTEVAGAVAQLIYLTQPSASNIGGNAFATQPVILARDQFGNNVGNAPITLSIAPGTGASGAALTCTTNPVNTNPGGVASFAAAACKVDLAGTYKLRATSGSVSIDSGAFNVNVGPASKIVFKSYPGTTTPSLLTPQPRVAVTDAGGNTVTSFPATAITLAINKNPASFSCTGGLTSTTVNGEAAWTGCTQTVTDSGYQLTATVGFATTTGANFAIAAPIPVGSISLTTFCGQPTPVSTGGTNQCAPDGSKTPAQTNIKLPQNLSEGVWLRANLPTNGANRAVVFEFSKDLVTWSPIQPATTDASGNASVFYRPSDNRYYRVSFAGASDLGAATSPTVRVVVRALVFVRPTGCTSSPCRIHQNNKVLFTVTARPNRAELPAQSAQYTVERKSGSTWVTVANSVVAISKSSGNANFSVTFNAKGTWRLRVNLQPTTVNANSFPTGYEYYSVS